MDKRIVTFRHDSARYAVVYPDLLEQLPLVKVRALLNLMLSDADSYANDEAIRITQETLETLIRETRAAWADASQKYQTEYREMRFHFYTRAEKREIKAENNRLISDVKRTKRAHERANKLFSFFQEGRNKYRR